MLVDVSGKNLNLTAYKPSKKEIALWKKSRRIDGLPFNDWLKKLKGNTAQRTVKASENAMISGQNIHGVMRGIRDTLNISSRSAMDLAHNAMYQAYNWEERQFFIENEKHIKALRFMAELDRNTTPICRCLDGREYPPREAPVPPLHWKCRSTLFPIFKSKEIQDSISRAGNYTISSRCAASQKLMKVLKAADSKIN